MIFAFSIIIYSISVNILAVQFDEEEEKGSKFSENLTLENLNFNDSINKNIYFIILDAMMPLKMANDYDIYSASETKSLSHKFDNLGFKTVENSFSAYGNTAYTMASMLRLEYPYTRNVRDGLWPSMMYQRSLKIALPELAKKRKNGFIWLGNQFKPCIERPGQPWECTHDRVAKSLIRVSNTIYTNSFIELAINKLIWNRSRQSLLIDYDVTIEGGQRQLKHFTENFNIDDQKRKNFYFVHQLSPHGP